MGNQIDAINVKADDPECDYKITANADWGKCIELKAEIQRRDLQSQLLAAKKEEDFKECHRLKAEIDRREAQAVSARRRRVAERLLHYENFYSSGAEGHPRYFN